jgi:hypothetical protein
VPVNTYHLANSKVLQASITDVRGRYETCVLSSRYGGRFVLAACARAMKRHSMTNSREERIQARIASASREELEDLRRRALAVLKRVQSASRYRLRSMVEQIEADVAIDMIVEVEAALKRRGRCYVAVRRQLLRMMYG